MIRAYNCNITPGFAPTICAYENWGTAKYLPVSLNYDPVNPGRCQIKFALDETATGGGTASVQGTGAALLQVPMDVPPLSADGIEWLGQPLELKAGIPPFPSRAEACSIQTPFQGWYVSSETFSARYQAQYGGNGQIPYFGAAYLDFIKAGDSPDALLPQLAPFSHVMLYLGRDGRGYDEPNQPYGDDQLIPYCQAADDLDWFVQQIDIVISRGFKPMFVIDGEDNPDWIRANFERFVAALRQGYDRTQYGPFTVAFDGVWPIGAGWTPEVVVETIQWMRSVLGESGYLFFWYGNGPANRPYLYVLSEGDYADPRFDGLDGFLTTSGPDEADGVSMANKAQYLVRDPNFSEFQPSFSGPFILHDCTRGPRFWGNIEWQTFGTCRDPLQLLKPQIDAQRALMQRMNVPCFG